MVRLKSVPGESEACSDSGAGQRSATKRSTRKRKQAVQTANEVPQRRTRRRSAVQAVAKVVREALDDNDGIKNDDQGSSESDKEYSGNEGSDSGEGDGDVEASRRSRASSRTTSRSTNAKTVTATNGKAVLSKRDARKQRAREQKLKQEVQLDAQRLKNEQMAKARMRFLLKQGDVFSHFVSKSGTNLSDILKNQVSDSTAIQSSRKRRRGKQSHGVEEDGNEEELAEINGDGLDLHVFESSPAFIKGGTMRDYQIEGLNWMAELQSNGMSGILADEMGLGKTLQSISMLGYMQHIKSVSGPHLVVGPKSTVSNWYNEVRKWCPSLRAVVLQGSKDQRAGFVQEHLVPGRNNSERTFDVLITSYELSIIEKTALGRIPWVYLVLDEAHRVKNEHSKLAQTLRMLSVQHRLLLTGTPLQNNLHELWALLNFLLPEIFSSSQVFDDWFNLTNVDDREAKETMVRQLHRILKPFMLRRLKKDVAKTLPPKKETMLYVGMSEMQRELYRRILERDMDAVVTNKVNKNRLQNIVMQLRKVTNHPYLINGVEDRSLDPLGEHMVFNSAKLLLLDKLLPKLKNGGNRVLIFSQMTRLLDILEDYLGVRNYLYCRIDGSTGYEEREDMIDRFNAEGSEYFVFLLSTRAGGLGINLATADTVILFDSDWNPQMDLQAQDRAHRIGQKKPVNVYRLVTEDSVEEKIVERAETKLRLDAVVIQQGRLVDQAKSKINKDDMLAMIRFGAANIFRSAGSTVTDEDIDAILQRGEEKTKALSTKLEKYESGDLLDFKLEYSGSIQEFDGIDYSAVGRGGAKRIMHGGIELVTTIANAKGKRKRSERGYKEQDYYRNISAQTLGIKNSTKRVKIPDGLKLKPFKKWHFFDEERLEFLYGEAIKAHRTWFLEESQKPTDDEDGEVTSKAADELSQGTTTVSNSLDNVSIEQFFTEEQNEERKLLLSEGMTNWSSSEYQAFVQGCTKYGTNNLVEVARGIPTKTLEEVKTYAVRFNEFGPRRIRNWDKLQVQFAKTETKIAAIVENLSKLQDMMKHYQEPTFQFRFNRSQLNSLRGKEFTLQEDILLLSLLCELGYGQWTELHQRVQQDELLPFSYYLKSRSPEDLQRRCNTLVRLVVKDVDRQTECAQGLKWKVQPPRCDLVPCDELDPDTSKTVELVDLTEEDVGPVQTEEQTVPVDALASESIQTILAEASGREEKRIFAAREKQSAIERKIRQLQERSVRKQQERARKLASKFQRYLVRHERKFSNERSKLVLRLAEYVDPNDPEKVVEQVKSGLAITANASEATASDTGKLEDTEASQPSSSSVPLEENEQEEEESSNECSGSQQPSASSSMDNIANHLQFWQKHIGDKPGSNPYSFWALSKDERDRFMERTEKSEEVKSNRGQVSGKLKAENRASESNEELKEEGEMIVTNKGSEENGNRVINTEPKEKDGTIVTNNESKELDDDNGANNRPKDVDGEEQKEPIVTKNERNEDDDNTSAETEPKENDGVIGTSSEAEEDGGTVETKTEPKEKNGTIRSESEENRKN